MIFPENVINKAKESCKNSNINVIEHFVDVDKLSKRANNAEVKNFDKFYKKSKLDNLYVLKVNDIIKI